MVLVFAAVNTLLVPAALKLRQKIWQCYYKNAVHDDRDSIKLKECELCFVNINKIFTFLVNIWPKLVACFI